MGLYNFHRRFAPHILSRRKAHTIRLPRRHADKPGSKVHLYVGLRQPGAILLGRSVCTAISPIVISTRGIVCINRHQLESRARDRLAYADGFDDWPDMLRFWREADNLPFAGHIIHWDPTLIDTSHPLLDNLLTAADPPC